MPEPLAPDTPQTETLLAMLGLAGTYSLMPYVLAGSDAPPLRTRLVVKALVALHPGRFQQVHLFGTRGSGWADLKLGCDEDPEIESFEDAEASAAAACAVCGHAPRKTLNARVARARAQQPARDADGGTWGAYLDGVAEAFRARTGVAARCHLLPLGENDAEMWETMALLAGLDIQPGRVSIDITHAMRHQPLFLFATLLYLDAVRPGVEVGDVFYGNLFAAAPDRKPVLRLGALVDVMAWTDAAQKFKTYGDAGPLAALLPGTALAEAAERFSLVLMGNAAHKLHDTARTLLDALNAFPEGQNAPFDLVREAIAALPRALSVDGQEPWEAMLRVAHFHAASRRPTLALLLAWEATLARTSDLLATKITRKNTSRLSECVAEAFPEAKALRADRDASAHARTHQQQEALLRDLDGLGHTLPARLGALEEHLRADTALDALHAAQRRLDAAAAERAAQQQAANTAAHEARQAQERADAAARRAQRRADAARPPNVPGDRHRPPQR